MNEYRVGYISGNTFKNKLVKYRVIDGKAVFEGDIILRTAKEMEESKKKMHQVSSNL